MTLPHWPAAMKRSMAAQYCSLSQSAFEREVNEGRLPQPVRLGGQERWARAQLDAALEQLAGDNEEWFRGSPLYRDSAA